MKIALIAALPVLLTVSACSEEAVDQATEEPLSETQMPEEPALTEPMPDGVVQDSDGNAVTEETLPDAGTDEMEASESTTDSAMESDADAEEVSDEMSEDSDTTDPAE